MNVYSFTHRAEIDWKRKYPIGRRRIVRPQRLAFGLHNFWVGFSIQILYVEEEGMYHRRQNPSTMHKRKVILAYIMIVSIVYDS